MIVSSFLFEKSRGFNCRVILGISRIFKLWSGTSYKRSRVFSLIDFKIRMTNVLLVVEMMELSYWVRDGCIFFTMDSCYFRVLTDWNHLEVFLLKDLNAKFEKSVACFILNLVCPRLPVVVEKCSSWILTTRFNKCARFKKSCVFNMLMCKDVASKNVGHQKWFKVVTDSEYIFELTKYVLWICSIFYWYMSLIVLEFWISAISDFCFVESNQIQMLSQ